MKLSQSGVQLLSTESHVVNSDMNFGACYAGFIGNGRARGYDVGTLMKSLVEMSIWAQMTGRRHR